MVMKYRTALFLGFILLFSVGILSACSRQNNVCPPIEGTPQPKPALVDLIALPPPDPQTDPITIEISGKMVSIDQLVEGPLCNDSWNGTVYVGCHVIVGESNTDADNNPLFLKGCDLKIESGTIVYVAAHNDAAYYKGCSCHTGEDPIP
jgi:hypothetical protein